MIREALLEAGDRTCLFSLEGGNSLLGRTSSNAANPSRHETQIPTLDSESFRGRSGWRQRDGLWMGR